MAQLDQFKGDYEKAVETKNRIQGEFQKRKNAEAANQSTAKANSQFSFLPSSTPTFAASWHN